MQNDECRITSHRTEFGARKTIAIWLVIAFLYFAISAVTFPHARYGLTPDGVSYVRLAQLWHDGDWHHAVSGYWAPLISWLTVLFMPFFSSPLDAAHAAMIVGGFVFFTGIVRLISAFIPNHGATWWFGVFAAGVVAAYTSTINVRCDPVFAGLIAWGCSFLLTDRWVGNRVTQILAGLFLALSFYAKSPGIPTFMALVFLAFWHEFLICRRAFGRVFSASCVTTLVFVIAIAPWIATLSWKYERFCFSTSGGINLAIMRPGIVAGTHPHYEHFLPPEPGHDTYWEAPQGKHYPEYSPFAAENFGHSLGIMWRNFCKILGAAAWFAPLWPVVLLTGYGLAFRERRRKTPGENAESPTGSPFVPMNRLLLGLAAVSACYCLPLDVEPRYLFVLWPFLIVATAVVMNEMLKSRARPILCRAVWLLFALATVFSPFLFMTNDFRLNNAPFRVLGLTNERTPDWVVFKNRLAELNAEGRLALTPETVVTSPVREVLFFAPFLKMTYYGHATNATFDEMLDTHFDLCVVPRDSSLDEKLSQRPEFRSLDEMMFPDGENKTSLKGFVRIEEMQSAE